ncbi:hypothetical protein KJ953_00825, partial [Patescibacteria group bacterium]|nr:hypothetical protein [Patescibacteria group bacterium]
TNTWDVAVYGLLLGVFVLVNFKKVHIKNLFLMIGVAGVVALPWLLNFKSFSDGVSLVSGRSPLWQMMVLWGGHIIVAVIAIFMARKDSGQAPAELDSGRMTEKQQIDKKRHSGDEFRRGLQNLMVLTLGITAILLLLIPEVVYVKDIYGSHQRANTMFKLTYQAFIMMGLLFGWVMGRILAPMDSTSEEPAWECGHSSGKSRPMRNPLNRSLRMTGIVAIFVLWLGFMLFPLQAFSSYYGGFKNYKGLDGLTWLKKDTEKWGMIEYLEKNKDGKNLLEAVGDSYSKLNSVSAFSGTPTVVGWRVHEWLWRGGYDVVGKREKMVKDFYETGDKTILESFNVGWIVVGVDERKEYKIDEKELLKLGEVVFSGEEGYLIKLP